MSPAISITGIGCLGALGHDLAAHLRAISDGRRAVRLLGEMEACPDGFESCPAAWIEPRSLLTHRKWSPATMAALHVAREAADHAGWTTDDRRDAVVFAGSSRGSIAGWLDSWPGRRALRLMSASNSLAAEPAAAVCAELGIGGPWQMLSSGCCAGLDALGLAALWLRSGLAPRALVVAVDLPLVGPMLRSYSETGILSSELPTDPIPPAAEGMIPAEGAAALCLEAAAVTGKVRLHSYFTAAGGDDPLGTGTRSRALDRLLAQALAVAGPPLAIVPHASGTPGQAMSEPAAIRRILGPVPVMPLKPWTGHSIGASGLLESALLAAWMENHILPSSLINSAAPTDSLPPASRIYKLASAMGGKHSLAVFESPT